jgi:kynurenine 3-monooxygenase
MPAVSAGSTQITIVGAGLGGALLACFLGRAGHRVALYERRSDPRAAGFVGGRSINLAISARGIDALRRVDLADRVLAEAVPMRGRMIHPVHGDLAFQPYSKDRSDAINSVSRGGLNLILLEAAAAHPNVSLHFDERCIDIDPDRPAARFINTRKGETTEAISDLIIGADGAYSAVRARMQYLDRFDYQQEFLQHGYKELHIPPARPGAPGGLGGAFAIEPNALHIWPRGGSMMIALPNREGSFTCTIFWPYQGSDGFDAVRAAEDVTRVFEAKYPDAVPLMPTLVEDYLSHPVGSMVTIRCKPWQHAGKVALMGDAAHAIVPFFGQGANAAFEDCVALSACLEEFAPDWPAALAAYEDRRREHADAIADMALVNFIEMRDKTASRLFRLKKRGEKVLHRAFPSWFIPLYHMISFTTIPYADARRRAIRQWQVLGSIAAVLILALVVGAILLLESWKGAAS